MPVTVAFACAVLLSLGAVPRSPRERPEVDAFASELRTVLETARQRHVGRAALLGELHDGDLDAVHAKVLARLAAMGEGAVLGWNRTLGRVESEQKPWSDARIAAFRAGARGVVEALVEASRTKFVRPLQGRHVPAAEVRNLANAECMLRLREGKAAEAIEIFLASVQFSIDVEAAQWLQDVPFVDADLAAMPHDVREQLADGLASADERLAALLDPRAEVANFALPLCDGSYRLWDWDAREVVYSWEFGFDPAARHLEGMRELFAAMPRSAEAGVTGEQREVLWRAVATPNGTWLSGITHEWAHDHEVARRRVAASYRMLRLAIAFHAREALPGLVDPWNGEPFEVVVDGDTATLRAMEEFEGREWVAVRR